MNSKIYKLFLYIKYIYNNFQYISRKSINVTDVVLIDGLGHMSKFALYQLQCFKIVSLNIT